MLTIFKDSEIEIYSNDSVQYCEWVKKEEINLDRIAQIPKNGFRLAQQISPDKYLKRLGVGLIGLQMKKLYKDKKEILANLGDKIFTKSKTNFFRVTDYNISFSIEPEPEEEFLSFK